MHIFFYFIHDTSLKFPCLQYFTVLNTYSINIRAQNIGIVRFRYEKVLHLIWTFLKHSVIVSDISHLFEIPLPYPCTAIPRRSMLPPHKLSTRLWLQKLATQLWLQQLDTQAHLSSAPLSWRSGTNLSYFQPGWWWIMLPTTSLNQHNKGRVHKNPNWPWLPPPWNVDFLNFFFDYFRFFFFILN